MTLKQNGDSGAACFKILIQYLPGGTEIIHEEAQDKRRFGRDSNQRHQEYISEFTDGKMIMLY